MNFDVIFVDRTCPKPYDALTLETEPMGGTEATVIRVAEGLAVAGLKVAVLEHNLAAASQPLKAFYLPLTEYYNKIKTKNLVSLRGTALMDQFDHRVAKFSWQHDLPDPNILPIFDTCIKREAKIIAVSRWHKHEIQRFIVNPFNAPKVNYIYNPVQDNIYVPKNIDIPYDRNKLIWTASPHKGLLKAMQIFERLVDVSGNRDFELHVFNPGYIDINYKPTNGKIVFHGSKPCNDVWNEVASSLCVFYPTQWQETFGLIAAEANAVKCPIATYELAALCETAKDNRQKLSINDSIGLINRVITWYNGDRPNVWGRHKFKLSEVVANWIKILNI